MNNFKKVAERTLNGLAYGRTKLDTEEIVNQPLTICMFDIIAPANGNPYAVVVFSEMPNRYYTGGVVLTKLVNAWCAGYDSIGDASDALQREGGVTVVFHKGKTTSNQDLVTITVC